jgi:hypothetical protein
MKRVKSYAALASVAALFLLLLLVPNHRASAQSTQQTTTQTPTVQTDDDVLVDGSKNPELIPDSLMYRMYYIAATEYGKDWGSDQKSEHTRSFFRIPGVSDDELAAVEGVLIDFRSQHDQFVADFKVLAQNNLNNAVVTDPSILTDQFDDLTDKTTKSVSKILKGKQSALEAHVQDEKKHIKVTN